MERDALQENYIKNKKHFNSHAHVERDIENDNHGAMGNYFNSHAHVERDFCYEIINSSCFISTHTLTWSVTISSDDKIVNNFISTHTLTWSVT